MRARFHRYSLEFRKPSGTSRGIMTRRDTWFIIIERNGSIGIGECGMLRGLSADDRPDFEQKLQWACDHIHLQDELYDQLTEFPSIIFGVEMALKSVAYESPFILFPSDFTAGRDFIPINGLIWMGSKDFMLDQINEKISGGYTCIKLKIGAIDFNQELSLLESIRERYSSDQIEIRLDANGAFTPAEVRTKLEALSKFEIHSIEQPIAVNQLAEMTLLCRDSPIPIALDEELIGRFSTMEKEMLLEAVRPQFIILKPSFVGGFAGTSEWLDLAKKYDCGSWVTSALESNIGLNAIAQWTYMQHLQIPQGLGTGALYTNNIEAPLLAANGELRYDPETSWGKLPFSF